MDPSASAFVPSWGLPAAAKPAPKPEPVVEAAPAPKVVETPVVKEFTPKVVEVKLVNKKPDGLKVHDEREHLNVVFIGHVDSGKSTLSGQMMYLTGMVDDRTLDKHKREAHNLNRDTWAHAYVTDEYEEEKAKGKTIDVGRAHFETSKKRYTILDAPGHKSYVPNMITGAAQADVGILVISARTGEFEAGFDRGGQTREHAVLAKTVGISRLIVVINKMDDESVEWDEERFNMIRDALSEFLKRTGFSKKRQTFVPVSGITGANLVQRAGAEICSWYDGPSLIEILDGLKKMSRDSNGPLRMPILAKYKDKGLTIMGKVESGSLYKGMKVVVLPAGIETEVTDIQVEDDVVEVANTGENVRAMVKLDESQVSPGDVLCSVDAPCPVTTKFFAKVEVTELLAHKPLLSKGYAAILHIHTCAMECEISQLLIEYNKKTGKPAKKHPAFAKARAVVAIEITTTEPICVETYEDRPEMGRFTIRDEGKTIIIGRVMKVLDSK